MGMAVAVGPTVGDVAATGAVVLVGAGALVAVGGTAVGGTAVAAGAVVLVGAGALVAVGGTAVGGTAVAVGGLGVAVGVGVAPHALRMVATISRTATMA
jgi:hypothetical protein